MSDKIISTCVYENCELPGFFCGNNKENIPMHYCPNHIISHSCNVNGLCTVGDCRLEGSFSGFNRDFKTPEYYCNAHLWIKCDECNSRFFREEGHTRCDKPTVKILGNITTKLCDKCETPYFKGESHNCIQELTSTSSSTSTSTSSSTSTSTLASTEKEIQSQQPNSSSSEETLGE